MPESPSREVATRTPQQELVAQIRGEQFRLQLELALPPSVPVERFVRVTSTALLTDPNIVKLDRASVFNALLRCAADGLMPDAREAALVDFKGKAVYIPMVGGYRKIASEHGWAIESRVVRSGDNFTVELGDTPRIYHQPSFSSAGDVVAAYAVARRGGERMVEVMSKEEIDKVRKTSRASDKGPWVDWYERMAEKTVARKLFKRLPLGESERVTSVLAADEEAFKELPAAGDTAAARPGESQMRQPEPTGAATPEEEGERAAGDPEREDPPPAFRGEEPPAPIEVEWRTYVLGEEFTRYEGKTIADVLMIEPEYVVWLASEAVEDEHVRTLAKAAIAAQS